MKSRQLVNPANGDGRSAVGSPIAKRACLVIVAVLLALLAAGAARAQLDTSSPTPPTGSPFAAGTPATPILRTVEVTPVPPAGIASRVGGQQAAAQATIAAYATREAQQAEEISRLQATLVNAQVTVTALAVVAANTVLDPTPQTVTIQADLDGMLEEDPDALTAARMALGTELSRFPLGCRAGFMLISGKAPDVDRGVALSQQVNELLREGWPDMFDEATGEAVFALPGEEPSGEVSIDIFFYSGCRPIE
jgi:hypothetical protein